MPKYVTGPGCCGGEVRPDVPVVFAFRPNRVERWLLAFFLYGQRIVKEDDKP